MKTLFVILLIAAACPGQTKAGQTEAGSAAQTAPAPSPAASPAQDENARKARAILDQAIQALGGSAYLNIQDISQEGRTYGFSHGESGTGAPFWRFYKYPDKERLELTKQRDWIIIHNGDNGYEITFHGTGPEDKEQHEQYLLRAQFALDRILREWLHQPGVMFFYDGNALADRKQTDKVTLLNANNQAVSIFVDTLTHLPVKKSFTHRDPVYRDTDTEEEVYGNYHTVQGIATPYDVARVHNGETANQRFMNKVTYNAGLADSMFAANITIQPKKKK
jgi:hypothetical protein